MPEGPLDKERERERERARKRERERERERRYDNIFTGISKMHHYKSRKYPENMLRDQGHRNNNVLITA